MENNRTLLWKTAASHGLVVGMLLVLVAIIIWVGKGGASGGMRILNWFVIIGSIYYSMKIWRDKFNNGIIKYSQALGYGVAVMFLASIVFGFYNIIYMNYLDPNTVAESMDLLEETYYEMGFSEERVELAMEMAGTLQTPLFQAFSTVFGTTFMGFLVSLIVALFVRREGDPFQDAMKNVPEQTDSSN